LSVLERTSMRSEFYVVNLVKSDEDARKRVARHLGLENPYDWQAVVSDMSRRSTMWEFQNRHGCPWGEVFEVLRNLIDQKTGSSTISESDLALLVEPKAQAAIGVLVGCKQSEAIQSLLVASELRGLLEEARIPFEDNPVFGGDSEWLLSTLLERKSMAKLQAAGVTDMWGCLNDFLRDNVKEKLTAELNCPPDDVLRELIRHVKARLAAPVKNQINAGEALFDIVALSRLRSYLNQYRQHLLREAKLQAAKARQRLPQYRVPAVLEGLIDWYVAGNYKVSLNALLPSRQLVRTAAPSQVALFRSGFPDDGQMEVVRANSDGAPGVDESIEVLVQYRKSATHSPEAITKLILRNDEFEELRRGFPASVSQLSPVGASLRERVVNTSVPLFCRWLRTLRNAISGTGGALDDRIVQAFVLAGCSLRQSSIVPELQVRQEVREASPTVRWVDFPQSTSAIAASIQANYRSRGQNFRVLGGDAKPAAV
jgi:hypothetical protein